LAKNQQVKTATIPSSGTVSDTVTCEGSRIPVALELPGALTGTTFTFRAATSSAGTPVALYYESTLYSVTVAASRYVSLNRAAFEGVRFLQIVSGSTEAAARTINVVIGD